MPTTGTVSGATGVISMVLLSAVVVLGILLDRRVRLPGQPRYAGLSLHRYTSLMAVGFLALHIVTAVIGPYARIGVAATVIPFTSAYARSWLGLVTCAVLACAVLLRSRLFRGMAQRLWMLVPGYGGLVLLAAGAIHGASQAQHLALGLGPLIAGAALVVGAGIWLAGNRPSPFWGRMADIADTMLIVALLPLALGVAGVFGYVRGLG